ncbi:MULTISPECIES: two-component system response regulator NarL [Hyphomicrobium]|jgi:two-component system nitrate/nitrite response regulator NarL|uniref:two-component system response regulator NarL n=1 Tax=Hyphomicrobium TaxID=81 RepID=UPI00037ACDD3|nr:MULTISPECIES: two-component system response regulator NarL [Hyphomicrobium]WBT40097.1 two-component system response regulator NarL [Hyphomicrobium sp. DMF-1]
MIKVMLIDDHALFRKGVGQIISDNENFEIVGEAASGQEGLDCAQKLQPDMVLIDLNMKGMDGLETLRRFKATDLDARYIVLTVSDAEEDLLEALRAGADGYLLKDMEPEDLCTNLLKASTGTTVLQDRLTEVLKNALLEPATKKNTSDSGLTDREHEILQCLADGLNNKTIARNLGISSTTVKVHIKNLLRKLNLTSRLEAAVWKHQSKPRCELSGCCPFGPDREDWNFNNPPGAPGKPNAPSQQSAPQSAVPSKGDGIARR